ncbi:hypothetical protein GGX14DRAFT_481896 [Mycena pura]|uniref:F-box domain-containing protein n=1 Tax=Mycena pura TaxID=153505 RepID=A0AAD6Y0M0_9AGAR|nr:hypothetical protein GGX14DRAFT_481896 [Mycena pura]
MTFVWDSASVGRQIAGEKNEINGPIRTNHCASARLPPELILLILRYISYRQRPRLDLFTSVIFTSCFRPLDVAVRAAPLICSSWHAPGTEALYERITLYTEVQCVLLHRTLQDTPSLRRLIRFLSLPSPREKSAVIPPSVPRISADILALCTHVQEVDVLRENALIFNPSSVPYLRFLRVSNATTDPTIPSRPPSIRFPALHELILNGYHFHVNGVAIDDVWPEFPQLKSLRLENCVFNVEDLTQILSRTTTKLQSLALFSVRYPFSNNELPSVLADSLEELWIENCWPLSFASYFTSYSGLRSLHLDWHLFANMVPFLPPALLCISVTVPAYVASSAPDYDRFEAGLERISRDLPTLEVIRVLGKRGCPLLNDEAELRKKLGLHNVRLEVELVHRGEACRRLSFSTEWHELLYI